MSADGTVHRVSDPVADILRAAFYYRLVDGHAVIDPALVLVAAARNDKAVAQPLLGSAVAEALLLLAAGGADAAGATEPVAVLREAAWWVLRGNDEKFRDVPVPAWSPEVLEALDRAADEAASAGAERIGVAALLLGLVRSADPGVRVLAGTTGLDLAATASALREQRPWAPEEPYTPLTDLLAMAGLTDQRYPVLIRWFPGVIRWFTTRRDRWGPILILLEIEILRQTVVTGHPSVRTVHLPLAIASMQEQLAAIGSGLAARYHRHNQGERLLAQRGFDLRAAQQAVESLPHDQDVLTPAEARRRLVSTGQVGDPAWSYPAATAMEQAVALSRRHRHGDIGTTHLLAASLTEADSAAALLLGSLGLDVTALRDDLDQQFTR